jgi:NAD(P)-dependent dehydrogenase (short-subunit alcohol dehydrogenase family)
MALEADLGIDSIKRVEILAAMRDHVPALAEIDPQDASSLDTLGDVVQALQRGPSHGQAPPEAPSDPVPLPVPRPVRIDEIPSGVYRSVVRWVPTPAGELATAGLGGGVAVLPETSVFAEPLATALKERGTPARVGEPREGEAVVWCGGLDEAGTVPGALALQREAFAMARGIARRRVPACAFIWDPTDPWRAGIAGLSRTARQEWSDTAVRGIALEPGDRTPSEVAAALADELWKGGADPEVHQTRDGDRLTPVRTQAPLDGPAEALSADAPILVTGGARGVTARVVATFVAQGARRILLLGRTALTPEPAGLEDTADHELPAALVTRSPGAPPLPKVLARNVARLVAVREVRRNIARLRARGAEVRYAAVDVRDRPAVADAVGAAREARGPFRGLVHGAGVLGDAEIGDLTDDAFATVFDTKVLGLRWLLDAVENDPLDHVLVFSSIAGRTGNRGQAAYAMANATLDAVATRLAETNLTARIRSVAFGPWDGGMVGTALARLFRERGIGLLPLDEGADAAFREWAVADDGCVDPIITAGGELAPDGRRQARVSLNGPTTCLLADHRIRGATVVPLALAGEWFARFAPVRGPLALFDLQVLRGITWSDDEPVADGLDIDGAPDERGFLMTLRDQAGAARYTAVAAPGRIVAPLEALENGAAADLAPYGPGGLFHGPRFHAIETLEGLGPEGVDARIRGIDALDWNGTWRTDVAALDGALQLAWLWTARELGAQVLPLRVAEVQLPAPGPHVAPYRARARIRSRRHDRVIADADVLDEAGELIAAIRGAELYVVPGGTAA